MRFENFQAQPTKLNDVLGDVSDDLHAKISFASLFIKKEGIGGTPAPSITIDRGVLVTAATRDRDGKEVSTYEVWFCLKGLISYKDQYADRFDRLSSPTDCAMAAGNYVFWTRKGTDQGPMVSINDIGANGEDRRIDLQIP